MALYLTPSELTDASNRTRKPSEIHLNEALKETAALLLLLLLQIFDSKKNDYMNMPKDNQHSMFLKPRFYIMYNFFKSDMLFVLTLRQPIGALNQFCFALKP